MAWPVSVLYRNQYRAAVIAAVMTKETTSGSEIEIPRIVMLLDE